MVYCCAGDWAKLNVFHFRENFTLNCSHLTFFFLATETKRRKRAFKWRYFEITLTFIVSLVFFLVFISLTKRTEMVPNSHALWNILSNVYNVTKWYIWMPMIPLEISVTHKFMNREIYHLLDFVSVLAGSHGN